MNEVALRPYQADLSEAIRAAWASGSRRVMAWLPTGGGKTELAVDLACKEYAAGGCTLFVVERKTLAAQARSRFNRYGLLTGLVRGEDTFVRGYEPVMVASIQSLASRAEHDEIRAALARVTLVVIDEAHIRHEHHDALDQLLPDARVVGLSATPLRLGLGQCFDALVRGPSYADLMADAFLVRPRYLLPDLADLERGLQGVRVRGGDFAEKALSKVMRDRAIVGDVVSTWSAHAKDRPTIAFAVDVAHSQSLADEFVSSGVSAEHIDYRTSEEERGAIFRRFREGQTRVLCSVAVLAIGFDEPAASCAILARPTLSLALHVQQIGRVLRPAPGKFDALILDHAGNLLRHGKVEEFVPPGLSQLNKHSDRKPRGAQVRDYSPCPECRTLLEPGQRRCPHCGHERARRTDVHHIDGELREIGAEAPGDLERMRRLQRLYRELLSIADMRGWKRGWAYHQMRDHLGFSPPHAWMQLAPLEPTDETIRLVESWRIAWLKRRREGGAA